MIINLKCSYLLYFTVFLIIIHQIIGGKSADVKVDVSKTTGIKAVKDIPLTTLKKEETTLAVNESLASTSKPLEEKKDEASQKENDKKEESIPEKVEPHKPPTVSSIVNPPKPKEVIPAQVPTRDPHAGRIVLLFIGFLFVCYVIIHNKNRIMGLIVEGRGGRINGRRGANVRYRRLNSTEDTAVVEAGIQ